MPVYQPMPAPSRAVRFAGIWAPRAQSSARRNGTLATFTSRRWPCQLLPAPRRLWRRSFGRSVPIKRGAAGSCVPVIASTAAPDPGGVVGLRQPRCHMTGSFRQPFPSLAIDINQPGSFVHWSIFNVSVANLVLIAVMVVIFGAALLLPFPRGERVEAAGVADGAAADE